ncbi:hypothetical protein MBLNU459_g8151t1 [Dothideomycetes sp. NU459]
MPTTMVSDGHRPPRFRLKLGKRPSPVKPEAKPEPVSTRPKRKSSRPIRYSEEVTKTPTGVKTSKISTPPTAQVAQMEHGSDLSKSSSPSRSIKDDIEDDKPHGYSADFLANFIEDASPQNNATKTDSVSADSDSKPDFAESVGLPFAIPLSSDVEGSGPTVLRRPQTIDTPETIIKKLQIACHALSNLNILSPVLPVDPAASAQAQSERTDKEKVDLLLSAVSDEDSTNFKGPSSLPTGEADEDLDLMIRNAMQMIRSTMVSKNSRSAVRLHIGPRSKKSEKSTRNVEAEKFAMSALGDLLDSNALNINCFISRERSHLTWHLYQQLLALLTRPNLVVPMHYDFVPGAIPVATESAMAAPQYAHSYPQAQLGGPPPAPHQFLLRDQYSNPGLLQYQAATSYNIDLEYQGMLDNGARSQHAQSYQPGLVLPRSGQAMRFSFAGAHAAGAAPAPPADTLATSPPIPAGPPSPHQFLNMRESRKGAGAGQVAQPTVTPSSRSVLQGRRVSVPGTTRGYPHPGAIVVDQ